MCVHADMQIASTVPDGGCQHLDIILRCMN